MRPLLRWAGSKKKLLSRLRPYWENSGSQRYVEPFAGSAALFFDLEPAQALLGDTNQTLIAFYTTLREKSDLVYELASSWACEKGIYYAIREDFKSEVDPVRRSAMFFYLNRNCFNGIFRTNTKGEFNVPYAATRTGAMPSWEEVRRAVGLLERAELRPIDFRSIVEMDVKPTDFVFLDPPYAVENRRVFVQYSAQTFGVNDLEQLSDLLHCIDGLGAKFVLSYAISRESLHFFRHWNMTRVACQRNVAGFSAHRRKAVELMISNVQPRAQVGTTNE